MTGTCRSPADSAVNHSHEYVRSWSRLINPNRSFTPPDEPRMIIAPPVEKPKSLQFTPEPQILESFVAKVIPPLILPIEPRITKAVTEKGTTRMLTIIMRSTEDKGRDIRRLKRICGMVRSSPGNDRFCFLIFENSHRHLLDFPNDTIGINNDLIRQLVELVGDQNVQVEIIRLQ